MVKNIRSLTFKVYKYLSNVATGIVGRNMHVSDVEMPDALGYTAKGNDIRVAFKHELYKGLSEGEIDMFRLGVTVHECMHQVFTNFTYAYSEQERLRRSGYFISEYDEWIYHQVLNLVEDPAIESMAPQVVGGLPLKALRYSIRTIDTKTDYTVEAEDEIHEITKALIQFGDVGLIKFSWTFDKAREVFLKIAPLFYEAINEPDGRKRIDAIIPIHKELRVLYREGAKKDESGSLSRSAEAAGKGSGRKGKASSEDSEINRKRKITIKKVKRDEWEKMKKEQEKSEKMEDDGKSDITVYVPEDAKADEKEKPEDEASIPMPMETSDKDDKKEDSSSKKSSDNADVDIDKEDDKSSEMKEDLKKDEDSSDDASEATPESDDKSSKKEPDDSEGKDTSGDKPEAENKDEDSIDKASDEESPDSDSKTEPDSSDSEEEEETEESESKANPFELSEDELNEMEEADFELSDEDLEKILDSVESMDKFEEPAEGMEEHEKKAKSYDDIMAAELHTVATCKNFIINAPAHYASTYEALKAPYEADIDMLRDELREIFQEDSAKTYFARSGRVNLKRMISRQSSTCLFERTERSTDKENIAIYMMVDMSGSTYGDKIAQERLAAILTAEALSEFDIPLYITGFTDRTAVELYHFVRWDNTEEERWGLLEIKAIADNFDAYCVRYAEEMLKERPEKRKLFIMVSDGTPASRFANGRTAIRQNARAVAHMKEAGISVLTLGVGKVPKEDFELMYGKNSFIDVSDPNQLFEKLAVALRAVINGEEEM